jgi:hypothetical protein
MGPHKNMLPKYWIKVFAAGSFNEFLWADWSFLRCFAVSCDFQERNPNVKRELHKLSRHFPEGIYGNHKKPHSVEAVSW